MSTRVILDLGCGTEKTEGAVGIDAVPLAGVDVVHDLNLFPYPFSDGSFDEIIVNMVLEHLDDTLAVMTEIHRLLRQGGVVRVRVPYYTSTDAFSDPTHKRFFTEKTFLYFTEAFRWNFYTKTRFLLVDLQLRNNKDTVYQRLRNLIPLKSLLKYFLNNMYDEIYVVLQKV